MMVDAGAFPLFLDGDVVIALTSARAYQLHSSVLRRTSATFRRLLDEGDAPTLSPRKKKQGKTVCFRINLTRPASDDEGIFVLQVSSVDPTVAPSIQNAGNRSDVGPTLEAENGKEVDELYRHYDNLFRTYYSLKPIIDDSSLTTTVRDSVGLLSVAEAVGSVDVISELVDVALLRQGQTLFSAIGRNAGAWSNIALRVRSPVIFQESIIHLVGQWPAMSMEERGKLDKEVAEVCRAKHEQLQLVRQSVEIRLLGHYPSLVQRDTAEAPGRTTYSGDIYMWMAIGLFRHWFSQSICEERGRAAKDGGTTLYRQIATAGYAYLDRKALHGFHQYFPMTIKGAACLENNLSAYKEELKQFVSPLLLNRSQLQPEKEAVPYLTCCKVEREDIPWLSRAESETELERASRRNRARRMAGSEADSEAATDNGCDAGDDERDEDSEMADGDDGFPFAEDELADSDLFEILSQGGPVDNSQAVQLAEEC
ncbi:MAG: hypothetical protein M1832_000634 [Thelocarpon impressellum]|nr:MAG: hypothetical protein M1832_000634 [Thelocarpon impressellum]